MNTELQERQRALNTPPAWPEDTPRTWARMLLLTLSAGISGVYGLQRMDGVFANAQTGNLLAMAADIWAGSWCSALTRFGAVLLFMAGIVVTVQAPRRLFGGNMARWQRCCLAVEALLFLAQGLLPMTALAAHGAALALWPVFLASALQYNTFNRLDGVPVSTLFSTNNLRQLALHADLWRETGRTDERHSAAVYGAMVAVFLLGAFAGLWLLQALDTAAVLVCAALMAVCLLLEKKAA